MTQETTRRLVWVLRRNCRLANNDWPLEMEYDSRSRARQEKHDADRIFGNYTGYKSQLYRVEIFEHPNGSITKHYTKAR